MVSIRVTAKINISADYRRAMDAMQPQRMTAFLERMGREMATQARKNIIRAGGKGGGVWPALSTTYARRKRKAQTPGRGSHKYAMLRDTGSMYDGMVGRVTSGRAWRVSLGSDGSRNANGNTVTNDELLLWHHEGRGNLPVRSAVFDMSLFERRFAESLAKFLGGSPRG